MRWKRRQRRYFLGRRKLGKRSARENFLNKIFAVLPLSCPTSPLRDPQITKKDSFTSVGASWRQRKSSLQHATRFPFLRKPIWLNIFPAQRKVFGKAQNAREQLTADSKKESRSLFLAAALFSLSLSQRAALGLKARFVFLGRLFLRARWRANFFLSFFSPPANEVSLLRAKNARVSSSAYIRKRVWKSNQENAFFNRDGRFFDANVFSTSFSERDERVSRTTTTARTRTRRRRRRRCVGRRKKSHHCQQRFEKQQRVGELDFGRGGDGEKNVAGGERENGEE